MQCSRECRARRAHGSLPGDWLRCRLWSGARLAVSGLVLSIAAAWCPAALFASDTAGALTPEELRLAIRQLDADEFSVRQTARQRLAAHGIRAVGLVRDAANSADGHLASECVSLLEQMALSRDDSVAGAAKQALDELSRHDNPATASLAHTALSPAQVIPQSAAMEMQMRLAARANVPPGIPFDANGQRQVAFVDNGRDVKITERRGGPISVQISQTVEGRQQTTEVEADSVVDLHRKDRVAYELYAKRFLRAQPPGANPAVVAQQMRMTTKIANGQREIEVEIDNRRIRISDKQGTDIRMEWTSRVNGVESTRTLEAKDFPALIAADRNAATEYLRYAQPTGGPAAFPAFPGQR